MTKTRSRERITKPCHTCGEPVTRLKSLDSPRWFCNHKCFATSPEHTEQLRARTAARYPDAWRTVNCEGCGAAVSRPGSQFKNRKQVFCSQACRRRLQSDIPVRQVTNHGYVKVYVGKDYPGATKTGHLLEHRKVMSEMLSRPLLDDENVHHINGDRADNRATNLELWSRSQPAGQRVSDKVRWARQILDLYGDLIPD